MYKNKRILGVVPARGGSKGLPNKNITLLLGKPLLAWTLEQARASRYLDRVIVSTDNQEIADTARRHGGDVPFMRPPALALDVTATIDVLLHAVAQLQRLGESYDYLALLEPTSPLRETSDIDECIERLVNHSAAKAIVSVALHEGTHPVFNVEIDAPSGCIRNPAGGADFKFFRRQDIPALYYFEGTIYISEMNTLLEKKTFYHELTLPYVVPRWKAPEIDELQDLVCVEALLKARATKQL